MTIRHFRHRSGRQPRRDRGAGHPHAARDGNPLGRGVQRRRRQTPATSPRPTSRSRIGPAPARQSYLNIDAVVDAARRTGAQAVHPGYGFLSENAQFAAALQAAGIVFIGPPVAAIQTMGDKIAAKAAVSAFGVPVVPGIARPGLTDDDLIAGGRRRRLPGAGQAVGRRRRQGHAGGAPTPPSCRGRSGQCAA